MFEAIYNFFKSRSQTIQGLHEWVASRIDHVLAAVIKRKIGDLHAFVYKFTDKLMIYIFSVAFIYILYNIAFYSSQFVWNGYKETHLGSLVMQGEGMSYFLADSFYNQTDYIVIFVITTYCALVLLPLFMVSRLFYINRLFYEGLPFPITSMIFGVPFAKFLTLNYGGDSSLLVPFIDLKFLQFFVPAILIVHPAMQFANWLMPEIDDLYRNPAYFWRRLNIEREIQKSKQRH